MFEITIVVANEEYDFVVDENSLKTIKASVGRDVLVDVPTDVGGLAVKGNMIDLLYYQEEGKDE